jgi:hypothetical protein
VSGRHGGCYTPAVPDPAAAPAEDTCPICGGPNGCGLAAGASTCWCFTASIPAAALEQVPDEARDRRCICATCADAGKLGQTGGATASSVES